MNGKTEGRKLNIFNPRNYLEKYLDLKEAYGDDLEAATIIKKQDIVKDEISF